MKHHFLFSLLLAAAMLCSARPARADKFCYVDVSFRILVKSTGENLLVRQDSNGNPIYLNPTSATDLAVANSAADAMLDHATALCVNRVMDNNWRGLRYRRLGNVEFVRPVVELTPADATFNSRLDSLFRSSYATGVAGSIAYSAHSPISKLAEWGPTSSTRWKWRTDAANFYLIGGFAGGIGSGVDNIIVQGGLGPDPATHELGHWFTLPHPFRVGQSAGLTQCIWGDDVATPIHGDGFTDTLIDHVDCAGDLNDFAGAYYQDGSGNPKKYADLTILEKSLTQGRFRDSYAQEFYGKNYANLTSAESTRVPPYDTAAPAPTVADRDNIAMSRFGVNYAQLIPGDQATVNGGINNPEADFGAGYIGRWWAWRARVDNDLLAKKNFNLFYDQTSAGQRGQIQQLYQNIMAYRGGKGSLYGNLSEQQLDRMCDQISGVPQTNGGSDHRGATRALESGRYWFFGGAVTDSGSPVGSSRNRFASAAAATVNNAALNSTGKDIVIGRPGPYTTGGATLRINKACTVRATRGGAFSLRGTP